MNRLFTFGCSFTKYVWPTWADILIKEFNSKGKYGVNYGQSGSGNLYIFIKLMEAIRKYEIKENDVVMICWTSLQREDRFVNGHWVTPGNIYTQKIYNDTLIDRWSDLEHFVYRDCALMSAAKLALAEIGCKYVSFSMSKLKQLDSSKVDSLFYQTNKIIDFYGQSVEPDLPPMMEFLGLEDRTPEAFQRRGIKTYWGDIKDASIEWHPFPGEHLSYIQTNILPFANLELSNETIEYANKWDEYVKSLPTPINLYGIEKNIEDVKINNKPTKLI